MLWYGWKGYIEERMEVNKKIYKWNYRNKNVNMIKIEGVICNLIKKKTINEDLGESIS